MNLFTDGEFKSAAGIKLPFKIDCDALSNDDLACLAKHTMESLVRHLYNIKDVIPVPRGGIRFANALRPYSNKLLNGYEGTLLVDDVWTTGVSMLRVA